MKRNIFTLAILILLANLINAQSPGFFLDDWEAKSISITDYVNVSKPTSSATAIVNIDTGNEITQVSKYLFGNNANTYMGQMIDQPVLLQNIRDLSPNVVRFPGGNLSNLFFWDMEVGAYFDDLPTELIDATDGSVDAAFYWSGKNTEGWTCTLENYYNMLDSTEQTGMITVNYSYARYGLSADPVAVAAAYAADWVRHDNGRTKYWEIGNENGGPWQAGYQINTATNQDGQPDTINGGIYGEHFMVFANAMRAAAAEIGHEIFIGAQLVQYEAIDSWNPPDDDWNELYFNAAGNTADFYIVHSYYTPYNENSTVETILNSARTKTESIMDWMQKTTSRAGVELKPIALTEWNTSAIGSMQAVSHINGMHAAMAVGEMMVNKYGEASRWDFANGWSNGDDHGMFNIGDEPGNVPTWNPRPDFYHLYYAQKYFGDRALGSQTAGKASIQSYATRYTSGQAAVMIANKGRTDEVVQITFDDFAPGTRYYWYTLEGDDNNGDFSRKVYINGETTVYDAGGPANFQTITARSATSSGGVKLTAPALSITHLIIDQGTGSTNNPPVAEISASQTSGEIALTVDFSAAGSSDPDGDAIEYMWDFGDGTNATGIDASHTYNTADDYTVTVTVFDGVNIDQASIDISAESAGATCDNPTIGTLPILQEGSGEQCLVVEGTITNVNSWGMWAVFINGVEFTDKYSDQIPEKINGKYFIYFNAGNSWSHVEINGENSIGTTYQLITSVSGQGLISPSSGTYDENTVVTLTATPEDDWEFEGWSGDVTGTDNPTTIIMDSDKTVTATFLQGPPPTYSVNVIVSGEGTVELEPSGDYYEGDFVNMTATPTEGYIFNGWSGDISSNDNPLSITITEDISLIASFIEESTPTYSLAILIEGPGTVEGIPANSDEIAEGTAITLAAIPDDGAQFDGWSGDATGTSNTITVIIDSDKEIIAHFSNIPVEYFTLTISTDGNGSISLNPAGGTYVLGTEVEVEAIPLSEYAFEAWSGDLSGSENPTTITMDADKEVFASFVEIGIPCSDPTDVMLSFAQDGAGEYCFRITEDIAYVNSWNMGAVTINYVDYTNTWSSSLPDKIEGAYYVSYEGYYPGSHFEATALKSADQLTNSEVKLYPNPYTESFTLRLDNPESVVDISIYDKSGRLIQYIGADELSFEMELGEGLAKGFYLMKVTSLYEFKTYKITKN